MRRIAVLLCLVVLIPSSALSDSGGHGEHAAQASTKEATKVTLDQNAWTLTFGPIDLPAGHSGELASSLPLHFFKAPKDLVVTGFRSRIFTKDGKELPGQYLHHILLQNLE